MEDDLKLYRIIMMKIYVKVCYNTLLIEVDKLTNYQHTAQ